MTPKTDFTREELIAICEQAIVPERDWADRDTEGAMRQVGVCWSLLKAGCEFRIHNLIKDGECRTDERTIWLTTYSEGFRSFEYGENKQERKAYREEEMHYLPTPERLQERNGHDWY